MNISLRLSHILSFWLLMAEIRLNVDNQLALTSKQKTRYFFIISFKGFISSKAAEQQPTAFLSSKLITGTFQGLVQHPKTIYIPNSLK